MGAWHSPCCAHGKMLPMNTKATAIETDLAPAGGAGMKHGEGEVARVADADVNYPEIQEGLANRRTGRRQQRSA